MFRKIWEKLTGVDHLRQQQDWLQAQYHQSQSDKDELSQLLTSVQTQNQQLSQQLELLQQQSQDPWAQEREKATAQGRPWVNVVNTNLNEQDPSSGYFELDWNEHFVKQLRLAGYQGAEDSQVVDQWFQNLCRNVLLENYEQDRADLTVRVNRNKLDNGRAEFS
jgi:hypothetical protein